MIHKFQNLSLVNPTFWLPRPFYGLVLCTHFWGRKWCWLVPVLRLFYLYPMSPEVSYVGWPTGLLWFSGSFQAVNRAVITLCVPARPPTEDLSHPPKLAQPLLEVSAVTDLNVIRGWFCDTFVVAAQCSIQYTEFDDPWSLFPLTTPKVSNGLFRKNMDIPLNGYCRRPLPLKGSGSDKIPSAEENPPLILFY